MTPSAAKTIKWRLGQLNGTAAGISIEAAIRTAAVAGGLGAFTTRFTQPEVHMHHVYDEEKGGRERGGGEGESVCAVKVGDNDDTSYRGVVVLEYTT